MTSAAGGRNDFGDSLAWAAFHNLNQQREARQRIEAGETQRSVEPPSRRRPSLQEISDADRQ